MNDTRHFTLEEDWESMKLNEQGTVSIKQAGGQAVGEACKGFFPRETEKW